MAGQHTNNEGIWDRMLSGMRRDPKKVWILGSLLGVLAVICGWEVVHRLGPAKAGAAVTPSAAAVDPDRNPEPGDPGGSVPAEPKAAPVPELPAPGSRPVDRDLFTPNPVYFPPHQKAKIAPKVVNSGQTAGEREEARKRAVQAQAQSLTLQSTVIGSVPTAIINGRVLRGGEWINGFRVVQVSTYRCLLEKDGIQVALELSK